jgi:hypothetical protein
VFTIIQGILNKGLELINNHLGKNGQIVGHFNCVLNKSSTEEKPEEVVLHSPTPAHSPQKAHFQKFHTDNILTQKDVNE